MPKKTKTLDYSTKRSPVARPAARFERTPLWCIWGVLALVAIWRVIFSGMVIAHPNVPAMQGAIVVHWRRLEEFIPWLALGLLFLGHDTVPRSLGQARMARIIAAFFALGVLATGLSIALDELDIATAITAPLAVTGYATLAWCSLLLAGRALKSMTRLFKPVPIVGERGGITIIDLWRFAATQWTLLMATALVIIAMARSKDERLGSESVRVLMFYIPAVGVLPNVMMAAGISLWNDMLHAAGATPARPRIRAWITSLAIMNLAPLLILTSFMGALHVSWLIYPGILLILFAIAMYMVGFPSQAWQGLGGKLHMGSWCVLALAMTAAGIERAGQLARQDVSIFYGYAWRHLWIAGAVTLWLVGMAASAAPLTASRRMGRVLSIVAVLTGVGVLVTTTILLTAAALPADGQVGVMQFLLGGTLPEAAAILLGFVAIMWAASKRQA